MPGRQFALLAITWIAAVSLVLWLVLSGRRAALEGGEKATNALSAVLEQQTARTFQAINLTLGAVGDAYRLRPRPENNDPGFRQMMEHRLHDLPFARAIFIVGPDGRILHDTDFPATPAVSLADRDYFRAHARGADGARPATVWPPVFSRSGTGWFLPTTRALGRSGAFEGVVVAAVQADYFSDQFRNTGLDDGYRMGLFYENGTLVAHWPARKSEVGKRSGRLFAPHLPASRGTFRADGAQGGEDQIVSYRVVSGTHLVVQVSRDQRDVLAEWRRTATGAAIAILALTSVLVWLAVRAVRAEARREHQRESRNQAEKLEALGQLTGGITHDFANFLNIMATNVALMQQRPPSPVMEVALANIERAVRGGTALTERLLSFARRKPLSIEHVQLGAWLQEARPLLTQAAGSGISVEVETGQPTPDILCDPGQLDMALVNLLVNAREAMDGSGRITLRVYPCGDNGTGSPAPVAGTPQFVCLTVEDSGSGMSDEARQRALEPFYTTKGDGGTGLGLPQVYGFMQQLGGTLSVESEPGRGTAIHLFFPVAPAAPPGRRQVSPGAVSGAPAPDLCTTGVEGRSGCERDAVSGVKTTE